LRRSPRDSQAAIVRTQVACEDDGCNSESAKGARVERSVGGAAHQMGGDVYYPDDERFSATGAPQWLRPEGQCQGRPRTEAVPEDDVARRDADVA